MTIPEGDPRIRLLRTSHVVYYHADILKAITFLQDFGLRIASRHGDDEIFFRGYGPDPYCYVARRASDGVSRFGGAAYLVESHSELVRAATIPGASPIRELDAPGGGEIVTLTDPVGHQVHLIWGQRETAAATPPPQLAKLVVNFEDSKPRVGTFQRLTPGPAPVHKWGHYGVTYPEGRFDDMLHWYTSTLALAISDIVDVGGRPSTAFFHIDRGLEYTDHHAFFFKRAKPNNAPSVAHAAFEVHDFDVQQLGHNHLEAQGYKLCWGVGRHVLGSQIFDY
ncbi:hypothetical protein MMC08_005777, partial [Hypocenomyce scalaris]|nr:hypothetical protein [Hypocenomyce scalaris]